MPEPALVALKNPAPIPAAIKQVGRVVAVDGPVVWIDGLEKAVAVGDRIRLTKRFGENSFGDVLRLRNGQIAVIAEEGSDGISLGDRAVPLGPVTIAPSEHWIGRVLDPSGRPLDKRPSPKGGSRLTLQNAPPNATTRRRLGQLQTTGLNVFDAILPIVTGQRIGLFAGSGVGKSNLLGKLARKMSADVVVLALIGERGREVNEFVTKILGKKGMARTVVIAASSDRPAAERRRCLPAAMTVAEYFRDSGHQVLLLADSITRFAEAHREVAIASGELPALRGFPVTTTQQITSLCERAGSGEQGQGDITAIFSVLVAGSDMDEPIADLIRGVLDGHVIMDRTIAERGRFPAIDVLRSVSRSLPDAFDDKGNSLLGRARRLLGAFEANETMIRAGLYREKTDPILDQAISFWPGFEEFLTGESPEGSAQAFQKLELLLRRSENGARGPASTQM